MALAPLSPLTARAYAEAVQPSVAAAVEAPQAIWGSSWGELIERHRWRGRGWFEAIDTREQFHLALTRRAGRDVSATFDAIARWGGLQPFSADDRRSLEVSLDALDGLEAGRPQSLDAIMGRRIAAASKIYAMYDPTRWVIYDSRVARALAMIVVNGPKARDRRRTDFPQPPGRAPGRGVVGFPALAHGARRQAVLGFLYASWFARAVAAELGRRRASKGPQGPWTAMHVELALFTAGGLAPGRPLSDRGGHVSPPIPAAGAAKAAGAALAAAGVIDWAKDATVSEAQRQAARRNAFRNGVRYAQQTGGSLVRLQFADGEQRYVVFKEAEPIAAFPVFAGDLNDALVFHERARLELLTPEEALERRRAARAKRGVRDRVLRRSGADDKDAGGADEGPNREVLALPAGDPLGEDELLDGVFDDDEEA
jgi:hypothetical protein